MGFGLALEPGYYLHLDSLSSQADAVQVGRRLLPRPYWTGGRACRVLAATVKQLR